MDGRARRGCTLRGSPDVHQIVFLIDLKIIDINIKSLSCDQIVSQVSRTVLKILTHYAAVVETGQNLRWGFKFCNSCSTRRKSQQDFREFSIKTYDSFEQTLKTRVLSDYRDRQCAGQSDVRGGRLDAEDTEFGCHGLQRALSEVMSDFQWERPDIRSPVRPHMRKNQHIGPLGLEPSNKNFIYLFSWCPDTPEAFASFFGCDKPCAAESLEALLPRRLLRQFREIHKLALYWIDMKDRTSDVISSCSPDLPCVRLMSQMLCSLSGCILPVQTVLHLGLRSDTYIHNTPAQSAVTADTAAACRQSGSLLPFSSVISTYAEPSVVMCQETTANRTTLFLDKDGCDQVLSHLYLYNITKYQSIAPDRNQNFPAECTITIEKGESPEAEPTEVTQAVTTGVEVDEDTPCFTAQHCPDRLRVIGATQQSAVQVDCLSTKPVYMCAPPRECKTTKGWNKLLLRLTQKQLALIVQCHTPGYESSTLGVLQPLTSVAATLIHIKSEMMLNLKKLLSFSSAVCEEKATNDIERFISEPVTHSLTAIDLPPQKSEPTHHFASVAPFHSASLEQFYQQGISGSAVDELSALLHINTDVAMKALTEEEKLMKKYQRRLRTNKSIARRPVTMQPDTSSAVVDQSDQENAPKETVTLPRTRSKTLLPSRNDMIIERSRHYQAQVQDKPPKEDATRGSDVTVQEPPSGLPTESADFQDEDELLHHLKESYTAGVDGETLTLTCAQTIISVTLHYYKAKEVQSPHELVAGLLSKNLFLSNKGIHDKYVGLEGPEVLEKKLREYEIQILLGLELAVIQEVEGIQMDEEKIEQIVMMLRSLSFLKDASYLADYLKNVLVENYLLTVPKILGQIYDELLQPLPEALSEVLSPAGGDADSSVVPSVTAAPSVESDVMSFEPPSCRAPRSRRLIHHLSMKPAMQKRQIVVEKKKRKNQTRTSARLTSTSKITNSAGGPKAEVRKVRRNLFTGSPRKQPRGKLQRSQTVSVMERIRSPRKPLRKTPRKKISKTIHRSKVASKSGLSRTPTGKHVLKTKHVTETPAHKQVSSAVLRQLEKERKHTRVVSSVTVVEESPMKLAMSGDNATKKTPRKTIFSSRRSFYSGANQKKSRNVEKYSKLEARMTQQFLQSPPPNGAINHLTPSRKIRPTFLFAKCISPSPRHKRALTFTADADKGIHSNLAGPNPPSSVKKSPRRLHSTLQGPHRTVLDSPSRHTRSHTVEDSPVKHRNTLSAGLDVDSPAKNTRGQMLFSPPRQPCDITNAEAKHMSPSSSQPQAEISQILSSPSQNTRSHTSLFSPKECPSVPGESMNAAGTPVKQHLLGNRFNMNKSLHSSPGNSKPRKVTLIKVDRTSDPQSDKWKPLFMGSMEEQEISGFSDQSSTVDSRNVHQSDVNLWSPRRSNHIAMESQRRKILESPVRSPGHAASCHEVAKTEAVSTQPQTPCKNQQIRPEFTPPSIKQKHKVFPRKSVSPADAEHKNAYQKKYASSQTEREKQKHPSPKNSAASRSAEPLGDAEQMSLSTSGGDQLKRKVCLKRRRRKSSPRNAGGPAGGPIKKQCLNKDLIMEAECPPHDGSLECGSQSVSSQEYFDGEEMFLSASESGAGDSLLDKVRSSSVVNSNVVEQPLAMLPAVRMLRKHSSLVSHTSSLSDCSSTHSPVPHSPTNTRGMRKSDEAHTPSNRGKSTATTNPSPADSVKGISPGRLKYSPYLSAKGLSALMNSPMLSDHSDESGHSGRLRFSRGTPVLINQSPVTSTRPYSQGPPGDKTAKKSRRSLYRTETNKQIS